MIKKIIVTLALVFLFHPTINAQEIKGGKCTPATNSRVCWGGKDFFLLGANLAWYDYGFDFGHDNIKKNEQKLRTVFGTFRDNHIHNVRWWVFTNSVGHYMDYDGSGTAIALKPQVAADIDYSLTLAEEYDLFYHFVLFNAVQYTFPDDRHIDTPQKREKFVNAFIPLFQRYGTNPRVMSWDLFNEPDLQGRLTNEPTRTYLIDLLRRFEKAIHTHTHAYVHVGYVYYPTAVDLKKNNINLSLEQIHQYVNYGAYDYRGDSIYHQTYATIANRYGINVPIIVGETDLRRDNESTVARDGRPARRFTGEFDAYVLLKGMYDKGYAGVWPWSAFPERTGDNYYIDYADMKKFAEERLSEIGPRRQAYASTPVTTCSRKTLGDANCDGRITLVDFEIWRKEFIGIENTIQSDFDQNGIVDIRDFGLWRRHFIIENR